MFFWIRGTAATGDTATTFGTVTSGGLQWGDGVRAASGIIYGVPYDNSAVLKIDPTTDTASTFGSVGSGVAKWFGAVEYGAELVCAPFTATSVLAIDPATDTTRTWGSKSALYQYRGWALSGSTAYGAPFGYSTADALLKANLAGESLSRFGSLSPTSSSNEYAGTILAPNGKIYAVPCTAASVLVIDPADDSTYTFGSLGSDSLKWMGGVLAGDIIYGVPYNATTVLRIDITDDSVTTFGSLGSGTAKWHHGCAWASGTRIYCAPFDAETVLRINTADDSLEQFGSLPGNDKWRGLVAADAAIYGIPGAAGEVLKITPAP